MLKKMGISAKLNSGFVILAGIALVLAAVSVAAMRNLKTTLDSVIQIDARRVELAGRIQYSSADLLRVENGIIFRLLSQDAAGSDGYRRRAGEVLAELRREFDELRPLAGNAVKQGAVQEMASTVQSWSAIHEELCSALQAQQYDVAQKTLSDRITPVGEKMASLAAACSQSVKADLEKSRQDTGTREQWILFVIAVFALLSLGCAALVFWVVRTAASHLRQVSAEMDAQAPAPPTVFPPGPALRRQHRQTGAGNADDGPVERRGGRRTA